MTRIPYDQIVSSPPGDWAPPEGKQRILDALAPSELVAIADNLIFELANARAEIIAIRGALRTAAEAIAAHEATLMLSDGYAAGKNAEVRAAWLKSQRLTDLAFRALVEAESGLSGQLAVAEAAESTLLRRWDLARAEIRLAESTLRFLAEV